MELYFGLAKELLAKGLAEETQSYDENNTYDTAIHFTADLDFYLGLAKRQKGPILDIGCGTGRVLLPLLRAGHRVVGMDLSPHMLDLAGQKARRAGFTPELHRGDMRDFSLEEEFSLILIPYFAMIYMTTDEERSRVIEGCRRHLAPRGMLAFDFDAGRGEPGLGKPWLGFQTVEADGVVVQTVQLNQLTQDLRVVNIVTYRFRGPYSRIEVSASVEASISASRLAKLLEAGGFTVQGFYQDYAYAPYSGGEECVVIALKS